MFEIIDFDMDFLIADLITFSFKPEKGPYKGNSFAGYMKICSNPLCNSQDMKCSVKYANNPEDLSDENRKYIFYVDILTHKYHANGIIENVLPDNMKFAEAFIREISNDVDWQELIDAFYAYKEIICRDFNVEQSEIPAFFSKSDMNEIDNKILNISYHEIFPFAQDWEYDDEKFHYLIVDQYCLAPGDSCSEVILSIMPWINKDISEKDKLVVNFDYKKKKWQMLENPSDLKFNQIMQGILKTIPDFDIQLQKRHEIMKKVYIKSKSKSIKTAGVFEKKTGNHPCSCINE